ncbi:hypothetical protein TrST_g10240 [Triparma strigata]|uniref:Heme-binding protein n=1 Tax=Triparma strigata TaxID=1606541 RepID=A0A9W6ZXH6_9STRA|nr:hypothetical protein TrST_g10240 [Triparma strigata]
MPKSIKTLTLAEAEQISAKIEDEASSRSLLMCFTIVDCGGREVLSKRMDGAKFTSVSIARNKALTSSGHMKPTSVLGTAGNRSIELSNNQMFSVVGGGRPICFEGEVVGAVGISGGTPAEDDEIARNAIGSVFPQSKL